MANTKISAMPSANPLDGTELVPLVQDGANVKVTIDDINSFHAAYVEAVTTVGTIIIPTTPILLKPTTIVGTNPGIDYDPSTGEFTFDYDGNYGLSISVNASASNVQTLYWYAENNFGAGWVVNTNSGKSFVLDKNSRTQVSISNFSRRVAGQKVRYWIYSTSDIAVNLAPTTLGATGAIVPAIRIQYSN